MPPQTDSQTDRYRDVVAIAGGGMGDIFRATDSELGREVVLKVLPERYAGDEVVRARFRREGIAAARLSGAPSIVSIFDVAEYEGRPAIVMEYLPGGSLEQRVTGRKPCPSRQVLTWLGQAAAALDVAHAAGVVHRDVKPANLLLDANGRLHVADFGIARATGLDSLTEAGTVLGTAGYLAPEQAAGRPASAASDRYALAVVAFELLTGRRPYESSVPAAETAAHVHAPIPSAHAANRALPVAVDAVFRRALAKTPEERYASASAFVDALRRALADDRWPEPATAPTRALRRRRPRRAAPLALVALALAGGGAAAALVGSTSSPHRSAHGPVTVLRTIAGASRTIVQTVTAEPPVTTAPPAATSTPAAPPAGSASGTQLNDAGWAKLKAGDDQGALPLLEQAVQQLQGTGSLAEAYADYNLAFVRFALHRCDGVLALLDRSQAIQGRRVEIDRLRARAQGVC